MVCVLFFFEQMKVLGGGCSFIFDVLFLSFDFWIGGGLHKLNALLCCVFD